MSDDENKLISERRAKLASLRAEGGAFPNAFRRDAHAADLARAFGERPAEWFESHPTRARLAGRMLAKRDMGKSSFVSLQDGTGQIQLFLQASALGETYTAFKGWDVGDIVGAEGTLMRTPPTSPAPSATSRPSGSRPTRPAPGSPGACSPSATWASRAS